MTDHFDTLSCPKCKAETYTAERGFYLDGFRDIGTVFNCSGCGTPLALWYDECVDEHGGIDPDSGFFYLETAK